MGQINDTFGNTPHLETQMYKVLGDTMFDRESVGRFGYHRLSKNLYDANKDMMITAKNKICDQVQYYGYLPFVDPSLASLQNLCEKCHVGVPEVSDLNHLHLIGHVSPENLAPNITDMSVVVLPTHEISGMETPIKGTPLYNENHYYDAMYSNLLAMKYTKMEKSDIWLGKRYRDGCQWLNVFYVGNHLKPNEDKFQFGIAEGAWKDGSSNIHWSDKASDFSIRGVCNKIDSGELDADVDEDRCTDFGDLIQLHKTNEGKKQIFYEAPINMDSLNYPNSQIIGGFWYVRYGTSLREQVQKELPGDSELELVADNREWYVSNNTGVPFIWHFFVEKPCNKTFPEIGKPANNSRSWLDGLSVWTSANETFNANPDEPSDLSVRINRRGYYFDDMGTGLTEGWHKLSCEPYSWTKVNNVPSNLADNMQVAIDVCPDFNDREDGLSAYCVFEGGWCINIEQSWREWIFPDRLSAS